MLTCDACGIEGVQRLGLGRSDFFRWIDEKSPKFGVFLVGSEQKSGRSEPDSDKKKGLFGIFKFTANFR